MKAKWTTGKRKKTKKVTIGKRKQFMTINEYTIGCMKKV